MADSLVDAWCRGLVAGRDEQPAHANPYRAGTQLAENWEDGWREGIHPRNWPVDSEDDQPEARPGVH